MAGDLGMVVYEGVVGFEILVGDGVGGGWVWGECDGDGLGAEDEWLIGAVEKAWAGHGECSAGCGALERVEGKETFRQGWRITAEGWVPGERADAADGGELAGFCAEEVVVQGL